jgi:hypothetical protein
MMRPRAIRSLEKLAKSEATIGSDEAGAPTRERDTRRGVAFKGFGLLEDGTSFGLSLLDLSYDGCKIATDLALFPGLKFELAVIGFAGTVSARVMWHKDGQAGIKFGSSGTDQKRKTPRAHQRQVVNSELSLRRVGRKAYYGRLFDVAPGGCKVEFIERPRAGETLWAKFDGLEAMEANVRWIDGFYGGLQFVHPIHPAIFDSLIAKLMPAKPLRH